MRALIVAATKAEIEPFTCRNHSGTDHLVTGVGIAATAAALARHLALHRYDLVINLGIGGSFDRTIALGSLVEISEDTFSELGAEDGETFHPLSTLGLGENTYRPTAHLQDYGLSLPTAKAITVNTVHGAESSIATAIHRWHPQVESMEGAAFFLACHAAAVPCLQVRAISNYVERRARERWQIAPAITNLNQFASTLIGQLESR